MTTKQFANSRQWEVLCNFKMKGASINIVEDGDYAKVMAHLGNRELFLFRLPLADLYPFRELLA